MWAKDSNHPATHHQGILAAMVVFQSAPSYLALQHVLERHDAQHVLERHGVPHDAPCDVTQTSQPCLQGPPSKELNVTSWASPDKDFGFRTVNSLIFLALIEDISSF